MTPKQRKRMTLSGRRRAVLLAAVLFGVANPAVAETRINPFFLTSAPQPESSVRLVAGNSETESSALPGTPRRIAPAALPTPRRLPRPDVESRPSPVQIRTVDLIDGCEAKMSGKALAAGNSEEPADSALPPNQSTDRIDAGDDRLIISAARRRSSLSSSPNPSPRRTVPDRWLQSITAESSLSRGGKFLDDAYREYSVRAWSSAESSAWKALELTATAIDIERRQTSTSLDVTSAADHLRDARTAIREARDFIASGAAIDGDSMRGITSSHQTPVFSGAVPAGTSPTEAADRYLDYARLKLAPLAARQVQAAQAMDLIAAIQLGRKEGNGLPEETALCLRRAALQGQPTNASLASRLGMQLADMGLDHEAHSTLHHAMSIEPTSDVAQCLARVMMRLGDANGAGKLTQQIRQIDPEQSRRSRMPTVVQLSPSQFASISPALNPSVSSSVQTNTIERPAGVIPTADAPFSGHAAATTANTTVAEPKPKRKSGFTPSTLARFRIPFTSKQTATETDPASAIGTEDIEAKIDDIYSADEFQAYADATVEQAGGTDSPIKRFFTKIPKLW